MWKFLICRSFSPVNFYRLFCCLAYSLFLLLFCAQFGASRTTFSHWEAEKAVSAESFLPGWSLLVFFPSCLPRLALLEFALSSLHKIPHSVSLSVSFSHCLPFTHSPFLTPIVSHHFSLSFSPPFLVVLSTSLFSVVLPIRTFSCPTLIFWFSPCRYEIVTLAMAPPEGEEDHTQVYYIIKVGFHK